MNRMRYAAAALIVAALAPARAADPMVRIQSRGDFPAIREIVEYDVMDWENDTKTRGRHVVAESESFLPPRRESARLVSSSRVKPAVAAYQIAPGLKNVVNLEDFGKFSAGQTALLEKNGFVVTARTNPQMFQIYEQNVYWNVPNFVSTDLFLHTWSDLFSYTLKKIERRPLFGWVKLLSSAMREESWRQYLSAKDGPVRIAARENAVHFAIAETLMKRSSRSVPKEIRPEVDALVKRIIEAAGEVHDPVLGRVDFSEFKPRGHYTRSEDWKNYFRAMMLHGRAALDVPAETAAISQAVLRSVLMVRALDRARVNGICAWDVWDRVYDLTSIFSGPSNVLTPRQVATCMSGLVTKNEDLVSPAAHAELIRRLNALPASRMIRNVRGSERSHQISFLGKRAVLDGEIMQKLVKWPERPFSSGLDVMAALGAERARWIQTSLRREQETAPWYLDRLDELTARCAAYSDTDWSSGVYTATLGAIAALATPIEAGRPFFMNNTAWQEKSLNTGCASWAELRHNTILYAEAYSAEGGGDQYKMQFPKGYIEPNAVFFERFLNLLRRMRSDLSSRGCMTFGIKSKLDLLEEMTDSAHGIVLKEVAGEKLTRPEYEFIHFIGSRFGEITTCCLLNANMYDFDVPAQWNLLGQSRQDQSLIADVGQSGGSVHEVGIGPAHEIFVVVPSSAGPRLTRGATYQFYEFLYPAAARLTDEEWKTMLSTDPRPSIPGWCQSFRSLEKKPGKMKHEAMTEVDWYGYKYEYTAD